MSALNSLVNPYASIGDLHNQGLDYVGQNLLSFDKVPTRPEIIINLSATFVSKTNIFGDLSYKDLETATSYALNYIALDLYPKDFTERQIFYAREAESIFDEYESPFNHIEQINRNIDDLVKIILESELSEEEQTPILCGLAVGKSSLYYWNQQFVNPNSYWSQINEKQASQTANLRIDWPPIDWNAVGKADLKGAVKGFLKGIFKGDPIGGAASGAVGASVKEIATQFRDYYFG